MKYKIAESIKRLRNEHGLTQNDLASLLSVTSQAVSRWESAQSSPDIEMIGNIAQYFGVSYDELLGGQEALRARYRQKYLELNYKVYSEPSERNTMEMLDALELLAKYDDKYLGEYFADLMKANRKYGTVPDTRIAEARNMLKKGMSEAGLHHRLDLLADVAHSEDEDNFKFWENECEDRRIDLWDEELVKRYSSRGDKAVFNCQRAKVVYQKVMRLVMQISAQHVYTLDDVKLILDTLNLYSTKAEDIFVLERLYFKLVYARILYDQNKDEEALTAFSELKDGIKLLLDIPEDAILSGSVPILSPLTISYSKIKHHHDLFTELSCYVLDEMYFSRIKKDARYIELQKYTDMLLNPKITYKIEEQPEWQPLVKKAEELRASLDSNGQAIVLESAKGTIYTAVYNDTDAAIDANGAMKLFAEMKASGDLVIKKIVCMWGCGAVDIPSYAFREKLVNVEKRNLSALMLLNFGKHLGTKELRVSMPASVAKKSDGETQPSENKSKKKRKEITEVVFDEITRNVLMDIRKRFPEKGEEKISEDILCFGTMFNLGNIDCDLYGDDRIESLNTLMNYGYPRDRAIQYRKEAELIASRARAGATLRVWYGNTAFSLCALYCLCAMLDNIECDIRVVEYPKRFEPCTSHGQGDWGMMSPKDTLSFADKMRELSDLERIKYTVRWHDLKHINSDMRIYDGEKILSVSADHFDKEFLEILEKKNFNRLQSIGEFIHSFPFNVEMGFFTNRIDYLTKKHKK